MDSKFFRFFPVYRSEYIKFFILTTLCFLVCANYTLLRTVKETLVITKPEMGVEIIPFLRTWMLMPIMLLFVKIYAMCSARYRQSRVCYGFVSFFLIYFILFIFVLFPYQNSFQLDFLGKWIGSWSIPFAFQIGSMLQYWSFSVYYCLAEVWGTLVVLILFWGLNNRSNSLEEAKRYYSPMLFITNLSGFLASEISLFFSRSPIKFVLFPDYGQWDATFLSITATVCIFTIGILLLFYLVFKRFIEGEKGNIDKDRPLKKGETNLVEIIKMLGKNRNIMTLGVMVFSYFFTSGIMELIWKYYLKMTYPNANDFNDYLSNCTKYISIGSTLFALIITGDIIRRFSWRVSALITPVILFIPLLSFVICLFFDMNLFIMTFIGASYYCLNRIFKFTFFDLSKELCTMEFSYEDQIKTKAVVDGIIPKLGKTCESGVLQVMLLAYGSFEPFIAPIIFLMLACHLIWAYFMPERKSLQLRGNL